METNAFATHCCSWYFEMKICFLKFMRMRMRNVYFSRIYLFVLRVKRIFFRWTYLIDLIIWANKPWIYHMIANQTHTDSPSRPLFWIKKNTLIDAVELRTFLICFVGLQPNFRFWFQPCNLSCVSEIQIDWHSTNRLRCKRCLPIFCLRLQIGHIEMYVWW